MFASINLNLAFLIKTNFLGFLFIHNCIINLIIDYYQPLLILSLYYLFKKFFNKLKKVLNNKKLYLYLTYLIGILIFISCKGYSLDSMIVSQDYNILMLNIIPLSKKSQEIVDEVNKIQNGEVIKKNLKDRFYKTFNDLSIKTQSNVTLKIDNRRDKKLVDNRYTPITINNNELNNSTIKVFNDLIKRFNRINKKYKT
jgi:hypothetical protein